jgi:Cu/Ag efflux protein CusF
MKKTIAVVLSLIFVLAVTSITFAAEKKAANATKATEKLVKGDISAVDANAMTITVKGKKGDVTVTVDDKTDIKAGKDKKTIADLKAGEKVRIRYHEVDGKNIAKSVEAGKK